MVLDLEHFMFLGGIVFLTHHLYFNYVPLSEKLFFAPFLLLNLNYRIFFVHKLCTQKSALWNVFNFFASEKITGATAGMTIDYPTPPPG